MYNNILNPPNLKLAAMVITSFNRVDHRRFFILDL